MLFGAHCWFIHPWFVAIAWFKLYGIPWDPRLWVAFFVHDLGYLFQWCRDMDGPEGDRHVVLGAKIMGWLFDRFGKNRYGQEGHPYHVSWYYFCFYHSRFMAKKYGIQYSRLCVADKLAIAIEPWWLYLPRVILSGEIHEYMSLAGGKNNSKYKGEPNDIYVHLQLATGTKRGWFKACSRYLEQWAYEHRNIKEDTWTKTKNDG